MAEGTRNSHFISVVPQAREGVAVLPLLFVGWGQGLGLSREGRQEEWDGLGHLFPKAALLWACWHKRMGSGVVGKAKVSGEDFE